MDVQIYDENPLSISMHVGSLKRTNNLIKIAHSACCTYCIVAFQGGHVLPKKKSTTSTQCDCIQVYSTVATIEYPSVHYNIRLHSTVLYTVIWSLQPYATVQFTRFSSVQFRPTSQPTWCCLTALNEGRTSQRSAKLLFNENLGYRSTL